MKEEKDFLKENITKSTNNKNEKYYNFNYISALIYFSIFIISYEFLVKEYNFFCILLGWSMFGISTLCYDSMFNKFSSDAILNKLFENYMMDFMGISTLSFKNFLLNYKLKIEKNKFDLIDKNYFLKEWNKIFNETFYTFATNFKFKILRLPFYILVSRLRVYQLFIVYLTFIFLWTYIILLTHNSKIFTKEINILKENVIYDRTWDIFPKSYFFNILTGNLNLNATNLVNNLKTRHELIEISKNNKNKRYKSVETFSELWKLTTHILEKEKSE